MDTALLTTFLTLARMGHMTRAAAALHLTQPAVSAQLMRLEEQLGQRLFDRTPRGLALTQAGELFRQHAEAALRALESGKRALDELAGLHRGALAIGGGATATTYLLPTALGQFHAQHPDIQIYVREQGSQSVVDAVLAGELELGVVTLPVQQPAHAARLHVEPWIQDELRLIVPHHHPMSEAESFAWHELDDVPLVLFEAGSAVRAILDQRLASAKIQTRIVMELRSIESIKQMVAQGIGAAFVSRFALSAPLRGIPCREDGVLRELALIWRQEHTLSAAASTFLATLRRAGEQL